MPTQPYCGLTAGVSGDAVSLKPSSKVESNLTLSLAVRGWENVGECEGGWGEYREQDAGGLSSGAGRRGDSRTLRGNN